MDRVTPIGHNTSTDPSKEGKDWVVLERFVFRRDGADANAFPVNETTACSSTRIRAPLRVSLRLVAPPAISRLYVEWPLGTNRKFFGQACQLVAAHRGRVLFMLVSVVRSKASPGCLGYVDDYFLYRPAADRSASVIRLPTCIRPEPPIDADDWEREREWEEQKVPRWSEAQWEPSNSESESSHSESEMDRKKKEEMDMAMTEAEKWNALERQRYEEELAVVVEVEEEEAVCSSLVVGNVGLVCREGEDDDGGFVVAALWLDRGNRKVSGKLSLLRSGAGEWEHLTHLPVHCSRHRDYARLKYFSHCDVVPFGDRLCWVDSSRGIVMLSNVLEEQSPKLSYLPFPSECDDSDGSAFAFTDGMHRAVCATDGGRSLKLIDVAVDKQRPPTNTFTIFSYTLRTTEEAGHTRWEWDKDVTPMTAEELWGLNAPVPIPHEVPIFPLVSMDSPQVLHFQLEECNEYIDTFTLVTVDMKARTVLSVLPYIKGGEQELHGEDADFAEVKCRRPEPFIAAEFPRSLKLTRKRKIED